MTQHERMRRRGWKCDVLVRPSGVRVEKNGAVVRTFSSVDRALYFWWRRIDGVHVAIREHVDGTATVTTGPGRSLVESSPLAAAQRARSLVRGRRSRPEVKTWWKNFRTDRA